ncbi:MAG: thioredoxin family protein [Desulfurococcaceae archaeon]
MYELKSKEEFIRAIRGNEVVLVEFYEPNDRDCQIMHESMKEFSKSVDQNMLFCRVNIKEHPEIADVNDLPTLRVYYRGELVFEQIGTLSTVDLNLKIVRRSIRETFKARDISVRV